MKNMMADVLKWTYIFVAVTSSTSLTGTATPWYCASRDQVPVFKQTNNKTVIDAILERNTCFKGSVNEMWFSPNSQLSYVRLEDLDAYSACDDMFQNVSTGIKEINLCVDTEEMRLVKSNFSKHTDNRRRFLIKTDSLRQLFLIDTNEPLTSNNHAKNVHQKRFLVNQGWSDWGLWQECIASHCGEDGIRSRERQCLDATCVGDKVEFSQCFKGCSQQTGSWSDWSIWSQCEVPCISSSRSNRSRVCMASDGVSCVGNATEQKTCAVDGGWSGWTAWVSNCTRDGLTHRTRFCDNPRASCGGHPCDGTTWEIALCYEVLGWTPWSNWSSCLQIAGMNLQLRNRTCRENACGGRELEFESCQKSTFTAWNSWGHCSATCGQGMQARGRLCIDSDTLRLTNESFCAGDSLETKMCFGQICADSNMLTWSEWSAWSHCNPPCNTGSSTRTRVCLDTGVCQGSYVEAVNCSQNLCNVDGGWSVWDEWSQCTSYPDYTLVLRYRNCTNPSPKNSGKDCIGDDFDIDMCKYESSWGQWANVGHCYKTGEDGNTTGLQYRKRTCHIGLSNIPCLGSNEDWQPCTLQGVWSGWGNWSACSKTCGQGLKQRYRHCMDAVNLECAGAGIENQTCHLIENCPVDGKFSEWSAWSQCPVTCNGGPITRNRHCNNPKPQFGGKPCDGVLTEASICNTQYCPVDGQWGIWESWTQCTCQYVHARKRTCDNPAPVANGAYCIGEATQNASCTPDTSLKCPPITSKIDGKWSEWSPWFGCSATCGQGTDHRYRACNNPKPLNGGRYCQGSYSESSNCTLTQCPVDGSWTNWGGWGTCSVTCLNGTSVRTRNCSNPEPEYGGKQCAGNFTDIRDCFPGTCKIDGEWTTWSPWFGCPVTCGQGTDHRYRACDDPKPQNGGKYCQGSYSETSDCNLVPCPVDGGWAVWGAWSSCSVTCSNGTSGRARNCSNPEPQHGGKQCIGSSKDVQSCFLQLCIIDGNWAEWGAWGTCSVTCSNGTSVRIRSCDNPVPQNDGKQCTGNATESVGCFQGLCPIDGNWGSWTPWSRCMGDCSKGNKQRYRNCDNPLPDNGGKTCDGTPFELTSCLPKHCTTTTLSPTAIAMNVRITSHDWSKWYYAKCSATCGPGTTNRLRHCVTGHDEDCQGTGHEIVSCNEGPCPG